MIQNWEIIAALLTVICAGVVYWRNEKDKNDSDLKKKDEELQKEIAKVSSDLTEKAVVNQKELIDKIGEVLTNQSNMSIKVEKALMKVEEHAKDIGHINNKLAKVSELVHELDKKAARDEEWKKRAEDKLKMS